MTVLQTKETPQYDWSSAAQNDTWQIKISEEEHMLHQPLASGRRSNLHHVRLIVSIPYKSANAILLWKKNTVSWLISMVDTIKRTGCWPETRVAWHEPVKQLCMYVQNHLPFMCFCPFEIIMYSKSNVSIGGYVCLANHLGLLRSNSGFDRWWFWPCRPSN